MKLLFLDIDGVMKPGRSYFKPHEAADRNGDFDPLAVECVNRICERSGALIVFNSVWNRGSYGHIWEIAAKQGIGPSFIAKAPITKYPILHDRLEAIELYLKHATGWTNWVALDDALIDHPHAIQVDPMNGISVENYRKTMWLLDAEDPLVLMI